MGHKEGLAVIPEQTDQAPLPEKPTVHCRRVVLSIHSAECGVQSELRGHHLPRHTLLPLQTAVSHSGHLCHRNVATTHLELLPDGEGTLPEPRPVQTRGGDQTALPVHPDEERGHVAAERTLLLLPEEEQEQEHLHQPGGQRRQFPVREPRPPRHQ